MTQTAEIPHPPKLLVRLSVLIIVLSLFLVCVMVASEIHEDSFFVVMLTAPFVPLAYLLSVLLYRGTFRYSPGSAGAAGIILYIIGLNLFLGFLLMLGEVFEDFFSSTTAIMLVMLLLALLCYPTGFMSRRWADKVKRHKMRHRSAAPAVSRRLVLLAVTGIVILMTATTFLLVQLGPQRYAENVEASEVAFIRLPEGATDVSYARGHRSSIAYEFTTDEAAFRKWIEKRTGAYIFPEIAAAMPLREIKEPITIARYGAYTRKVDAPVEITLVSGLYLDRSPVQPRTYFAFDRTTGRAYYNHHHH